MSSLSLREGASSRRLERGQRIGRYEIASGAKKALISNERIPFARGNIGHRSRTTTPFGNQAYSAQSIHGLGFTRFGKTSWKLASHTDFNMPFKSSILWGMAVGSTLRRQSNR